MENNDQQNWQDPETWVRFFIMIIMGFFYWFAQFVVFAIALVQLGFLLITGERSAPLQQFAQNLARYIKQLVDFLIFNDETRPFPFSEFPNTDPMPAKVTPAADDTAATAVAAPAHAPRKKKAAKKRSRKSAAPTTSNDDKATEDQA